MEKGPVSGPYMNYFNEDDPEELALLAEIEALEKSRLKNAPNAEVSASPKVPVETGPIITRITLPEVKTEVPLAVPAAAPTEPPPPSPDTSLPRDAGAAVDSSCSDADSSHPETDGAPALKAHESAKDRRMLKDVMKHLDVTGSGPRNGRERRLETMSDEQRRAFEEQQLIRNEWRLKREMREKEELEKLKRGKGSNQKRSDAPRAAEGSNTGPAVRDVPAKTPAELRADSKKLFAMWNQDGQATSWPRRDGEERSADDVDDYDRRGDRQGERPREPRGGGIVRLPDRTRLAAPSREICHKCGEPGHFVRDCPTIQTIQDAGQLTQLPSMRDLSTAAFAPHNKFAVGETVLVPSTRGGFTYARITGLLVEEHCFFDPSIEHKTQTWRVCYLANRNTLYKDLPTPYVGKLRRGPLTPADREAELRDLASAEADEGERTVGRKPSLKDLQMVVISPQCSFEVDEIVLVPRSAGGYTYGRIAKEAVQVCKSAFEPAVSHQLRAWRVIIDEDASGGVMRKDLIAACIGKVSLLARPAPPSSAASKHPLKGAYKQFAPSGVHPSMALKRESELDDDSTTDYAPERRRPSDKQRPLPSDPAGPEAICYKCGEPGHFARDCGQRRLRRGKAPDRGGKRVEPREPRPKRPDAMQGLVLEADIAPTPSSGEVVYESQMLHDMGADDLVQQPTPGRSYASAARGDPPASKSPAPSPVISPQPSIVQRPSPIGEGAPWQQHQQQYPEFQQFPDTPDSHSGLGFDLAAQLRRPLFDPQEFSAMSSLPQSSLVPPPLPSPFGRGVPAFIDDDTDAPYTRNGYQNGLGFHLPDLTGSQWFDDIQDEFNNEPLPRSVSWTSANPSGGFSGGLEGATDEDNKNDETFDVPNPEAGSLADLAHMTISHERTPMPAAVLERSPQWLFGS
eukprot:TRINITY_DN18466_c0_g1_i1.p1 TRINITY_DN18466_c0_g1~~TRINITY_DN18466_c0_g1_i1.p1  ORF type:complete len:911 (-),score=220.40 TRINITY_DN18466_c0_g1_i1:371-3103(-)